MSRSSGSRLDSGTQPVSVLTETPKIKSEVSATAPFVHTVFMCCSNTSKIAQKIKHYAQLAERGCLGQRHENDAQEKGCDDAACRDDAVVWVHDQTGSSNARLRRSSAPGGRNVTTVSVTMCEVL